MFNHLNQLNPDICLQEIHFLHFTDLQIKIIRVSRFVCPFNSRERGVSIPTQRKVTDTDRWFIILNLIINNINLTTANLYGSNTDVALFPQPFGSLGDFTDTKMIIGGDFNTVLNPRTDRDTGTIHRGDSEESLWVLIPALSTNQHEKNHAINNKS